MGKIKKKKGSQENVPVKNRNTTREEELLMKPVVGLETLVGDLVKSEEVEDVEAQIDFSGSDEDELESTELWASSPVQDLKNQIEEHNKSAAGTYKKRMGLSSIVVGEIALGSNDGLATQQQAAKSLFEIGGTSANLATNNQDQGTQPKVIQGLVATLMTLELLVAKC